MLKILFYQNERGESVDDRLVRQKKKRFRESIAEKEINVGKTNTI